MAIIVSIYISKLITNPVSELAESAERISKEDFSHIITIKSNDETGKLSKAFNNMNASLEELTDKLEEKIVLLNQSNNEYATLNEEYETRNEDLFEAKQRAEESDKLKTAFLANLAHEIRF